MFIHIMITSHDFPCIPYYIHYQIRTPGFEMKRKSSFSLLDASVRHKTHSSGGPAPWFPLVAPVGCALGKSRWEPLDFDGT